jgi:hypothetical protein
LATEARPRRSFRWAAASIGSMALSTRETKKLATDAMA